MTWDPPITTNAEIKGYVINWDIDMIAMDEIVLGNVTMYLFKDLLPGQTIYASICAITDEIAFRESRITGICSGIQHASVPVKEAGGPFSLSFLVNMYRVHLVQHGGRGRIRFNAIYIKLKSTFQFMHLNKMLCPSLYIKIFNIMVSDYQGHEVTREGD